MKVVGAFGTFIFSEWGWNQKFIVHPARSEIRVEQTRANQSKPEQTRANQSKPEQLPEGRFAWALIGGRNFVAEGTFLMKRTPLRLVCKENARFSFWSGGLECFCSSNDSGD